MAALVLAFGRGLRRRLATASSPWRPPAGRFLAVVRLVGATAPVAPPSPSRFALAWLAGLAASAFDAVLAVLAAFLASLTDRRLSGPRTGERSMNTQPTWGTGLPPTRRPWSNSQPYWPWNSWNESFDSTTASARSAICNRNASPRPMTPAGGVMQLARTDRIFERVALARRRCGSGSSRRR